MRQGDSRLTDIVTPVDDVHPVEVHGTPGIITELACTTFTEVGEEKEDEGQGQELGAARHGGVCGLNAYGPVIRREAERALGDTYERGLGKSGDT